METLKFKKSHKKIDDSEFDIDNLGDNIIKGLKEIIEAKEKGIKLPDARELLKELQNENTSNYN